MKPDMVNHPPHYTSHPSGVEAIDVGRHLSADWFNAFKYVFRADHRNGRQDIEKAIWYAKDGIAHNLPVHAPSWRFEHQQRLQKIIDSETDVDRRQFFITIKTGQSFVALDCIESILERYPS